ncbi:site-2 protease family protein [Mycolicibacterium psychrotolerans]|uniref:Zinc metalloprotease n=1 Tax=Mycolicibacterium psychrotolerans TaxID=216929 RepID=A0A7I7MCD9_9MYCO|nr:site-2 protease family protein [Mycolicibacterium psychrotolerans]BBX69924.1 zinc metalloprotease [Mycolicibacterium psychrotolerans]
MNEGIPLGRVMDFPLSIDWSVLVIMWLFTWSLAATLPDAAPGRPSIAYWLAGACGAAVLLASLLAHELTHAVVARRRGVEVLEVKLWLFGGIARLGGEAKTPGAEFRIAVSGPVTSLLLAAVFAGLAAGLRTVGADEIVVAVAWWLAGINLILGLFNLLPGAPLDGGRILRAYLWRRHGDGMRAAVGAARAGRRVAYALMGLGLLEFLAGSMVGGVWMAFVGWFLFTAARDEEAWIQTRRSLTGVSVLDVMTADPHTASGGISVEEFIQQYLLGDRHSAYPVTGGHGAVTGLISLTELRRVAPDQRATTLVRDAAIPRDEVPVADPHEPFVALLERLARTGGKRALVLDAGRVAGIVTTSDITRWIDVRRLAMPELAGALRFASERAV